MSVGHNENVRMGFVHLKKGLAILLICICILLLVCACLPQTDLVDQNLLNFLPVGEHSDVYKALSTHPTDPESLGTDFLKSQ